MASNIRASGRKVCWFMIMFVDYASVLAIQFFGWHAGVLGSIVSSDARTASNGGIIIFR